MATKLKNLRISKVDFVDEGANPDAHIKLTKSKGERELYVLAAQKGPFEPEDIRQCVYIERREIMGKEYIDCKPAYCRKRWYMMGGNFLYTSDSRFKEITGISYPIAIHDRYEGR